jgi:hypothetical protein
MKQGLVNEKPIAKLSGKCDRFKFDVICKQVKPRLQILSSKRKLPTISEDAEQPERRRWQIAAHHLCCVLKPMFS